MNNGNYKVCVYVYFSCIFVFVFRMCVSCEGFSNRLQCFQQWCLITFRKIYSIVIMLLSLLSISSNGLYYMYIYRGSLCVRTEIRPHCFIIMRIIITKVYLLYMQGEMCACTRVFNKPKLELYPCHLFLYTHLYLYTIPSAYSAHCSVLMHNFFSFSFSLKIEWNIFEVDRKFNLLKQS